jgi:hypothetical protein
MDDLNGSEDGPSGEPSFAKDDQPADEYIQFLEFIEDNRDEIYQSSTYLQEQLKTNQKVRDVVFKFRNQKQVRDASLPSIHDFVNSMVQSVYS